MTNGESQKSRAAGVYLPFDFRPGWNCVDRGSWIDPVFVTSSLRHFVTGFKTLVV